MFLKTSQYDEKIMYGFRLIRVLVLIVPILNFLLMQMKD